MVTHYRSFSAHLFQSGLSPVCIRNAIIFFLETLIIFLFQILCNFHKPLLHDSWVGGFPGGTSGKESARNAGDLQKTWVQSLGWEAPLEQEISTHSRTLDWKIPWGEELGGLQTMGLQRVSQDLVTAHKESYRTSPTSSL